MLNSVASDQAAARGCDRAVSGNRCTVPYRKPSAIPVVEGPLFQMKHSLSSQSFRYLIVGGVVYGIDVGTFVVLIALAKNHYLEMNVVAKTLSAFVGFFLHRHFTFSWEQRHSMKRQFILYVLLFAFNMALSTGLIYLLVGRLSLPTLPSRIAVDMVVIVTAFIVSRQMVFRTSSSPVAAKR